MRSCTTSATNLVSRGRPIRNRILPAEKGPCVSLERGKRGPGTSGLHIFEREVEGGYRDFLGCASPLEDSTSEARLVGGTAATDKNMYLSPFVATMGSRGLSAVFDGSEKYHGKARLFRPVHCAPFCAGSFVGFFHKEAASRPAS